MVQKSFYAMLLEDIKDNQKMYPEPFVNKLRENNFKFDNKNNKIL